jgi:hypothetical protein
MRSLLIAVYLPLSVSCASPAPARIPAAPATSSTSICAGYEDILGLADRPYTPCEVDTQTAMTRRPVFWRADYDGPCQFVELQVIVDNEGHLEPGSPSVLRTNAPAKASEVTREVGRAQFRPGRREGVPVRQIQRYYFASPRAPDRCQ